MNQPCCIRNKTNQRIVCENCESDVGLLIKESTLWKNSKYILDRCDSAEIIYDGTYNPSNPWTGVSHSGNLICLKHPFSHSGIKIKNLTFN